MNDEDIEQKVKEFITFAREKDINRLLCFLMNMNSTVRHFKISNLLFIELLKQIKLSGLLKISKSFMIGQGR